MLEYFKHVVYVHIILSYTTTWNNGCVYCIYRLTALLVESERLHTKPLVNYARDHPSLISDLSIFQHPCDAPFFGHLTTRAENVSGVLSSPYPTQPTVAATTKGSTTPTTSTESNSSSSAHINSTTSTALSLPPLPTPTSAAPYPLSSTTTSPPQPPSYGELYQYTDTEYDNEFAYIHDPEWPDTDLTTYLKTVSDQKLSLHYINEKIEYEHTSHLSQLKRRALIKNGIIKKRGPQVLETSVTNKNLLKMDIISRLNCEIVSDESVGMSILNDLFDHSAIVAVGVILEEVAREMMGAWRGAADRQGREKRPKRMSKSSSSEAEPVVKDVLDVTMDTEVDREDEEGGDGDEEETDNSSDGEVGADDEEENEVVSSDSSDDGEESGSDRDSSVGGEESTIKEDAELNDTSPIKHDPEQIPQSSSSSSGPSIKNSPTSAKNAELSNGPTTSTSAFTSSKLGSTKPPASKPTLKPVMQTGPLPYPNSNIGLKAECAMQLQGCYWESVSAEGLTHILEVRDILECSTMLVI